MKFTDNIHGVSLEIEEGLLSAICKICIDSFPNETGGFLVGNYSKDNSNAIVSRIVQPVSISAGPVSYERNTNGMESVWDKLYEEGLFYLGEWHSHPNGNALYSITDKNALTNIGECDQVKIANPIMLIIGLSKTKVKEIKAYYYKNKEIIKYE